MQQTLSQAATDLAALDAYSPAEIDAIVDASLVGFGTATATKRAELGELFERRAPASALAVRIRKRVLRDV